MPLRLPRPKKQKKDNPLIEKRPRIYALGQHIMPKRDLTRFVKWPKYIQLQRKKRVLLKRLKVPPPVNQFNHTLDKTIAVQLFKLLNKMRPEDKAARKKRRLAEAKARVEAKKEGKAPPPPLEKPIFVKCGLNHVTTLIEKRLAQLVVIAHDVDPIELVIWLPSLCRKMKIPFCIVKGKARLGRVVHKKTATCLAIQNIRKEDKAELSSMVDLLKPLYLENTLLLKQYGGQIMGTKHRQKAAKRQKLIAKEEAAK